MAGMNGILYPNPVPPLPHHQEPCVQVIPSAEEEGYQQQIHPQQQMTHSSEHSGHLHQSVPTFFLYQLGLSGSSRIAFYVLLLLISVTVLINSIVIVWIMMTINFSTGGLGKLKIDPQRGVKLDAPSEAIFLTDVYANRLMSTEGRQLTISNLKEVILSGNSADQKLLIGSGVIGSSANHLAIREPGSGRLLFLVDNKENLVMATPRLKINNRQGIRFTGTSIQVPQVSGDRKAFNGPRGSHGVFNNLTTSSNSNPLRIESLSRGMKILGPSGVSFKSIKGSVTMSSLKDWRINSTSGRVRMQKQILKRSSFYFLIPFTHCYQQIFLSADDLSLDNLKIVFPTKRGKTYPGILQLCICPQSGRLFTSPPEGPCLMDSSVCSPVEL